MMKSTLTLLIACAPLIAYFATDESDVFGHGYDAASHSIGSENVYHDDEG